MTYRDDHEAALARAEALEKQLAREQEARKDAETDAQKAKARAAQLEQALAAAPAKPEAGAAAPRVEKRDVDPTTSIVVSILILACVAFLVWALVSRRAARKAEEERDRAVQEQLVP